VHKVLKKHGNSKFSHSFNYLSFFTADDSFADGFCIVFHESNFGKMKVSDGSKVFSFSIEKVLEKVWKMVFENVWELRYEWSRCCVDEIRVLFFFSLS